jgi:hypothetical protein
MRQELPCAVHQCHLKVLGVLKDEKVKEPRARMRVEKALVLIRDIAEGRAGADHLRDLRGGGRIPPG